MPKKPALLFALAVSFAAPAHSDAPSKGEEVVKKSCAMCHQMPGMGAPLVGSKADWTERVRQGADKLYANAINGYQGPKGFMPAKGANPALSDDDVRAAVDYMIEKAK